MNISDLLENKLTGKASKTIDQQSPVLQEDKVNADIQNTGTTIGSLIDPAYSTSSGVKPLTFGGMIFRFIVAIFIFNVIVYVAFQVLVFGAFRKNTTTNADINYQSTKYSPTTTNAPTSEVSKYKPLTSFASSDSTWEDKFSINTGSLKDNVYTFVYFNRQNSSASKNLVEKNDLSLSYDHLEKEKYKISTDYLAVYAVGKKNIATTTNYSVRIDVGWSRARLLINKKVVFDGAKGGEVFVTLPQGEHVIELEFISSSHVPEFSVVFQTEDEIRMRSTAVPKSAIRSDVPIWYVGIYEPSQRNVDLVLPKNRGPITLLVSSYKITTWKVQPAEGTTITSVIIASYKNGSTVTGLPQGVPVSYVSEKYFVYTLYPDCPQYMSSQFYCESLDSYKDLYRYVKSFSNDAYIATFTGAYSTSSMVLPGKELARDELQKLDAYSKKVRLDWEQERTRVN